MWIPYEIKRKEKQDFNVRYRLYTIDEGGRKATYQGLRCDFSYEGDDIIRDGIYAIHPEFEDANGKVLLDNEKPVSITGTARMWILFPKMREEIHQKRIIIGTKGFFMEGIKKIGEVEVIDIVGLYENKG